MLIKRENLNDLLAHLSKKEITLIVGPRQAGKTTLMQSMQEELKKKGEKFIFLSLDFERDLIHFQSQFSLINRIKLDVGLSRAYVFIDEIQRKENAGLFLKGLYDMQLPYKFIVSGSGSLELKEKIHESLTGRKQIFEVCTISFSEFVNHKTDYKYEGNLKEFFNIKKDEGRKLLLDYLNYGGYPRVILEETEQGKTMIIDEIIRSYIEKDISYLLRVEKIDAFRNLVRLLSAQIGCLVNINELSTTLGISSATLKNYLYYAEKTFIIKTVTPYFKNLRKELTKTPVIYFSDLGFANYMSGVFGKNLMLYDRGFLFQNFVYLLLNKKLRYQNATIHFWRTKDKAEVDFIIDRGISVTPVEVKCMDFKRPTVSRSLRSFIEKYKPKDAYVINLSYSDNSVEIDGCKVSFIPYHNLLEEFEF